MGNRTKILELICTLSHLENHIFSIHAPYLPPSEIQTFPWVLRRKGGGKGEEGREGGREGTHTIHQAQLTPSLVSR